MPPPRPTKKKGPVMSAEEQSETKAAEARLLELKHEVQSMLEAERQLPHSDLPGWQPDCKLEWITEDQAQRLYERWLDLQIQRHAERPDVYGPVRSHNGQLTKRILAYVAEKKIRLQEIQAEVQQVRERYPSPSVAEEAAGILSGCGLLEEIYSETGPQYGRIFLPIIKRGLT